MTITPILDRFELPLTRHQLASIRRRFNPKTVPTRAGMLALQPIIQRRVLKVLVLSPELASKLEQVIHEHTLRAAKPYEHHR